MAQGYAGVMKTKRRPGRPKSPKSTHRSRRLVVYMEPRLYGEITRRAEASELTVSTWLHGVLSEYMEKESS